jgi:hypothetical protein
MLCSLKSALRASSDTRADSSCAFITSERGSDRLNHIMATTTTNTNKTNQNGDIAITRICIFRQLFIRCCISGIYTQFLRFASRDTPIRFVCKF